MSLLCQIALAHTCDCRVIWLLRCLGVRLPLLLFQGLNSRHATTRAAPSKLLTIVPVVTPLLAGQLPAAMPGSAVAVCPPLVSVSGGVGVRAAELRLRGAGVQPLPMLHSVWYALGVTHEVRMSVHWNCTEHG